MINLNIDSNIINKAYKPYLTDYSNRYEVYYGGAGSGKSYFIAQKLIIKALSSKRKILIIRKVGRTLKDSVFQLIIDLLNFFKLKVYCNINLSTFTITLPNESIILFKGLDDSEKIKSITGITDIWTEEATEITQQDFTQLDLRLRAKEPNLQFILSFNPVSKANWCYKYWFADSKPNTLVVKTTYKDNRFLPEEYINSLEVLKEANPTYYRIYALGEFCSLNHLIFNNWETGVIEEEHKKECTLLSGLDFGYVNDATAFIASYLDEENKVIYIDDEHYEKGMLNNAIANMINYKGYAKELIIADCAEQKSIEEIKRLGVRRIKSSTKGKGSVLHGIQKLQQYKLIVNPNCVNTIIELNNYCWQKDKSTDEYINEPIDDFNHCIDALRYSLQCVDNQNRLHTMDKAILGL